MKYGLSEKQLQEIKTVLSSYDGVEQAVLFGSRAIDTYKEASDVDIAIKGEKADWSLAIAIKDHLEEETYLPFFFDVVAYESVASEELKQHIAGKGKILFKRGVSEWRECTLGDAITLQRGHDLPKSKMVSGEIPVAGSNGIIGCHNISTTKGVGITIGRSGNIGNAYLYKNDFWAHNTTLYVKNFKGNDEIFIYYFLRNIDFKSFNVGSAVPTLNRNHIHPLDISLPPLPEQKAIATILSSLDNKIDLLHRQNKTLEALAETLFRQWFVEEAGDWEDGTLGDVLELNYGKALKNEIRTGSGYPVIGSSGIVGYHADYLVEKPGIVIGRKGTLGKVTYLFDNFFPIDTTYFIKSKRDSTSLFYEYFLLKTLHFENSDSAVPGLNRNIALSEEIKIPPENITVKFDSFCKNIFLKTKNNINQIKILEKLRDTLLPKLMSNEIKIAINE